MARKLRVTEEVTYTVQVHDEGDEGFWAEVLELPGCFASGRNENELREALLEAISLYLSAPGSPAKVSLLAESPSQADEIRRIEEGSHKFLVTS